MEYSKEFRTPDGQILVDQSNWERVDAMTDEEIEAAALSDPDAQPVTDFSNFRRLYDLEGDTLIDKLRSLKKENKKLLSIRYDADLVSFFKSKGKGYQKLMNNILREYMEKELQSNS